MSSTDESIRYVGENLGEEPSEATSKRSGSHPPSSVGGRRWSLCQAARCLLDESSAGEGNEEEEDSSPGERDIVHRRRGGCLEPGGVGFWAQHGLPVVSGSQILISCWRSLVSLLNL
ncbi:UNVERIFIED_CONTAM: hypothetical protein Sradi_2653100 [Sesamum radiatum]|uniref:Uncharacterized protein n=1 Tax=Sesamum radiatum TaxID=300843 RepID=A0AAW2S5Q9_SESRA